MKYWTWEGCRRDEYHVCTLQTTSASSDQFTAVFGSVSDQSKAWIPWYKQETKEQRNNEFHPTSLHRRRRNLLDLSALSKPFSGHRFLVFTKCELYRLLGVTKRSQGSTRSKCIENCPLLLRKRALRRHGQIDRNRCCPIHRILQIWSRATSSSFQTSKSYSLDLNLNRINPSITPTKVPFEDPQKTWSWSEECELERRVTEAGKSVGQVYRAKRRLFWEMNQNFFKVFVFLMLISQHVTHLDFGWKYFGNIENCTRHRLISTM